MSGNEPTSAERQPIYTANFTRLLDKVDFYSADELEAWAQSARAAFAWLQSIARGNQIYDPIIINTLHAYDFFLKAATSFAAEIRKGDQQTIANARSNMDAVVTKHFRKRIIIPPEDPRVAFLQKLAATDPTTAVTALGYFTNTMGPAIDSSVIKGIFRAMLFELGISDDTEATRVAFDKLLVEFRSQKGEISKELADSRHELSEIKLERKNAQSTHASQFGSEQSERQAQFEAEFVKSKERLAAFEQAYSQELATHSAVRYWAKKALVHRGLAAVSVLFAGGTAFIYLLYFAPTVFERLVGQLSSAEAPQWRIGIALALALLGIWILRILVRIFLSQVHLAADASHRRVTILSYLALLKDTSQPISEADRTLVLGTVFRPISDGIIRDDAMPPSPWEALTRPPKG